MLISDLGDDVEWLTTVSDDTEWENSNAVYFQSLCHKKTFDLKKVPGWDAVTGVTSTPQKCMVSKKYKITVTSNQDSFLAEEEGVE